MINRQRVLVIIGVVCVVFLLFVIQGIRSGGGGKSSGTLKVWGVFDTTDNWGVLEQEYRRANKRVKIDYRNFGVDEYEELLIGEIAEGEGPDIALIHNTWLPRHHAKFAPLTSEPANLEAVKNTFVQTVATDLVYDGKLYALPLYVDSLGLYYNTDHYQTSVVRGKPASTWKELQNDLLELNVPDSSPLRFSRSGVAMGTANNISRASDLLYLLFLQGGESVYADKLDEMSLAASAQENVLDFYTSFADRTKSYASWGEDFSYYTDAFAAGKVSTIFGYAYLLPEIKSKGEKSKLNFATAPIPQKEKDAENPVTLANYWALAINRNSKQWQTAMDLIQFLAFDKAAADKYFELTSRPPARRDLIEAHQYDPQVGGLVRSALYAKTFPIFNNGLYDRLFAQAINDVVAGRMRSREALQAVENKINDFLLAESSLRK